MFNLKNTLTSYLILIPTIPIIQLGSQTQGFIFVSKSSVFKRASVAPKILCTIKAFKSTIISTSDSLSSTKNYLKKHFITDP